jgi:hypothetical protein
MQLTMVLLTILLGLIFALGWLWLGPRKPRNGHSASEAGYRAPVVNARWGHGKDGRHIR